VRVGIVQPMLRGCHGAFGVCRVFVCVRHARAINVEGCATDALVCSTHLTLIRVTDGLRRGRRRAAAPAGVTASASVLSFSAATPSTAATVAVAAAAGAGAEDDDGNPSNF
jgi:hypothetical protein